MRTIYSAPLFLGLFAGWLPAAEPVDYQRDVKPLLLKHCGSCHGADKQRSGLRLDTAKSIFDGGNSGPAIVPSKSGDSLLIKAVIAAEGVKVMPPKEPRLSAAQIAVLKTWIDQGAKAPAGEVVEGPKTARTKHWAFQAPQRLPLPAVKNSAWPRTGIDHFILARLEKENIQPAPEADRATLIRRVSLDLTGLPPTPQEVDEFLADSRGDAYERLVDRLLNSPHYGERWGRHWLDLARYADSNGYTIDGPRTIWKYRDWVIDAFNRDLPFDQFTIEQLAGDMLPHATVAQRLATGFHRNTLINQEGGIDVEQFRVEAVVDRVNTTAAVFLGLTLGCAQCHDHKFDPLSQREYYQVFAFLNNADEPALELPTPEQLERRAQLRNRIAGVEKELRLLDIATTAKERAWEAKLSGEDKLDFPEEIQRTLGLADNSRDNKQKQALTAFYLRANHVPHALGGIGSPLPFLPAAHVQASLGRATIDRYRAELRQSETQIVTSMVMQERKAPRPTTIHIQGDFTRKGAAVTPGTLAVLHPLRTLNPSPARGEGRSLNRLDLAQWIVDPANPLTARVTMNRFWQHYFGLGLVETENDFGTQGTLPSHPELLDWLSTEFIGQKWSMKAMHRLIVTSAVYRQSSRARPELAIVDARNRLLARQNRLRLEAEVVRDVALAASGLLSRKMGGPSVFPPQPDGVFRLTQVQRDWKPSEGPDRYRRGLYTYFWRSAAHPALTAFDAPDANTTCTRRNRSNTPLQALTLLNDRAFFEFAQALAGRIMQEAPAADGERIKYAFQLCMGRAPTTKEAGVLLRLLSQQQGESKTPADAWLAVARVLLNLDEFITRE